MPGLQYQSSPCGVELGKQRRVEATKLHVAVVTVLERGHHPGSIYRREAIEVERDAGSQDRKGQRNEGEPLEDVERGWRALKQRRWTPTRSDR